MIRSCTKPAVSETEPSKVGLSRSGLNWLLTTCFRYSFKTSHVSQSQCRCSVANLIPHTADMENSIQRLTKIGQSEGLCKQCASASLEALGSPNGYLLNSDMPSLITSSHSCRMCKLVKNTLQNVITIRDSHNDAVWLVLDTQAVGKVWVRAFGLKLGILQLYTLSGM